MPNVGDGTGITQTAPQKQGLTSNEDKEPNAGGESGGTGPKLESGGNRKSPK